MVDENTPVEENEVADENMSEDDMAAAMESDPIKPSGDDLDLEEMEKKDPLAAIPTSPEGSEAGLEAIYDIPVTVAAVLGTSKMHIHQLLKLGRGAVVELDRKVGEAIDIYVNDRLVARGEIVIVEDKLGVTMTEIVKSNS
jgi:flagellar motor switch protein FliN/FliY